MRGINTLHFLTMILLSSATCIAQEPIAVPDGYAALNGGTTGGGNATPIMVSTPSAFRSAVNNDDPAVIVVQGRLNVGNVDIGSNKTIVGADQTSGLYGGHVRVNGSNYIFQNLIIGPSDNDAMELSGATNVFIHKCEFYDGADGNLDIVRASDYVTVSWCKFYYVDQIDHKFSILLGNSDDRITDRGTLHVTLHHNWFAEKCRSRMPRVRFGHVHIYNNYYNSIGNNYCIGIGVECHIRVENSYFDSINQPWADYGGTENGEIGWSGLRFVNCSQPTFMPNAYPVFTLPYDYEMDEVDDVKELVRHPEYGAGNRKVGKEPPKTPIIEVSRDTIEITVGFGQDIPDESFQVWNSGIDMLSYQVQEDSSLFSVSPENGSSDSNSAKVTHTLSFTNSSLEIGHYVATISVIDDGSGAKQETAEIQVIVTIGPRIEVEPLNLDASAKEGDSPDQEILEVWNSGTGTLHYEVSSDANWISVNPPNGSSVSLEDTQAHTITYNTTDLPAGLYTGTISVSVPGTTVLPIEIPVSVVMEPIPIIAIDRDLLNISVVKGSYPDTVSFEVWNMGTGELVYNVSENIQWLTITPENGSSDGPGDKQVHSVYVSPRALTIGNYLESFSLTSSNALNSPRIISISLSVLDPNASPWNPDSNGDMDTGSFLGWINVIETPWIWSYILENWMFVNEESLSESGGWIYFPNHG